MIAAASSSERPAIISVATEEVAIEAGQPDVRKDAAATRSSSPSRSTRKNSRMESPHTGLVTKPSASASAITPALRGCSKWSISVGL